MSAARRRSAWLGAILVLGAAGAVRAADPPEDECVAANNSSARSFEDGQLREARADALLCSAPSCPPVVRDICLQRLGRINEVFPTVVFEVRDGAGNDVSAVEVTMDGKQLADHLDGTPLSIEPGSHQFLFQAAASLPLDRTFVIRQGEKGRRLTIVLSPRPLPAAPFPRQRILALVAAGVGVVGVGVGIGFGIDAMVKHDEAQRICPEPQCPDGTGVTAWNRAMTAGTVATYAFAAGAVGLAAGAVLWFTARPEGAGPAAGAHVEVGLGSVQLRGAW